VQYEMSVVGHVELAARTCDFIALGLLGGMTMPQVSALDYEQLVAQYQHDLSHLLRGHHSLDFLEIWVPDENHVKSLLNMVEAAQSFGCDRLVVKIGAAIVRDLDAAVLLALLGSFGAATFESAEGGVQLEVSGMGRPRFTSPAYRREAERLYANMQHIRPLELSATDLLVRTTSDAVSLSVLAQADGTVTFAAHDGGSPDVRAALDGMCAIMLGRPLQEAADHGVIRLESAMRDTSLPPPVPGIVNAEFAEPVFGLVQKLVRELHRSYSRLTESAARPNTFADAQRPSWLALSAEAQFKAVNDTVGRCTLVQLNASADEVRGADDARVICIEKADRVLISFRESVLPWDRARLAMKIEAALQKSCDPTLQVFLFDLKDDNAARRL
jgi:hypothetical protein